MNAMPAVMPSLVAQGALWGEMTTSALWLHFMGLILGLIGSSWMGREVLAYYTALRSTSSRQAFPAGQAIYGQTESATVQAA